MPEILYRHWLKNTRNTDRMVFFSDAIFAIAITILILQIDVPELVYNTDLSDVLSTLWPRLMSFVISFFVISRFWLVHLNLYSYLKHIDIKMVVHNMFFMGCIVFLPFATDFYGAHSSNKYVLAFYVLTVVLTSFASYLMWVHVLHNRDLMYSNVEVASIKRRARIALLVPLEFLAALGIIWLHQSLVDWYWAFFLAIVFIFITVSRLLDRWEMNRNKKVKKKSHA